MIHLLILAVHLLATIAKLVRPGGVRAVVAESLVLKHQLLISSRARRRAPNLNSFDRFFLGLGSLFVPPSRIPKLAVILKPRTLFRSTRRSRNANISGFSRQEVIGAPARKDHRRSSSTRSSSSNAAIAVLAVPASHRRLRTPLASISTKTSFAGCSRNTIDPRQEPMARPGCPLSGM
jgi:hypothetical protein